MSADPDWGFDPRSVLLEALKDGEWHRRQDVMRVLTAAAEQAGADTKRQIRSSVILIKGRSAHPHRKGGARTFAIHPGNTSGSRGRSLTQRLGRIIRDAEVDGLVERDGVDYAQRLRLTGGS
jgi:hypothetical protein